MKQLSKDDTDCAFVPGPIGEIGDGDGGGKQQKCCSQGNCNRSVCSTCVYVPKGSHADCSANPNAQVCDC